MFAAWGRLATGPEEVWLSSTDVGTVANDQSMCSFSLGLGVSHRLNAASDSIERIEVFGSSSGSAEVPRLLVGCLQQDFGEKTRLF